MKRQLLTALAITALAIPSYAAAGGHIRISGRDILDNTVDSTDLGPDVTHMRALNVTVNTGEDDWVCDDPADDHTCHPVAGSGAGVIHRELSCPSGNVTGGGVKLDTPSDGFNFQLYDSYPVNDHRWAFDLYDNGPDPIDVQLRVECI